MSQEKGPFNFQPIIFIGGIAVIIAMAFAYAMKLDKLVVITFWIVILLVLGITFQSKLRQLDTAVIKGIGVLIALVGALLFFKFLLEKMLDFISADVSIVSPAIFFFLSLAIAYLATQATKKPDQEEEGLKILSFGWFWYWNFVLVEGMATAVMGSDGAIIIYSVAIAIEILTAVVLLKTIEIVFVLSKTTKITSEAFTAIQIFAIPAAMAFGMSVVNHYTNLFYWWWFFVILSGVLIGFWMMFPIIKSILRLP